MEDSKLNVDLVVQSEELVFIVQRLVHIERLS